MAALRVLPPQLRVMERLENLTLATLAQRIAGGRVEFSDFHAKVYGFIVADKLEMLRVMAALDLSDRAFPNQHPAVLLVGDFSKLLTTQVRSTPCLHEERKLAIHMHVESLRLPSCDYLCLVSPFARTTEGSSYGKAIESIAFLRTLLALFAGWLSSPSQVAEFDFDIDGKLSVASAATRMPRHADFLKVVDASIAQALSERLPFQSLELRERFQTASNFFSKALSQTDEAFRFVAYWVALEVLVGGRALSIQDALAGVYRCDRQSVNERLLFNRIKDKRDDLIHYGKFGKLLSYEERLMQLYFFDILLDKLNIPSRSLSEVWSLPASLRRRRTWS